MLRDGFLLMKKTGIIFFLRADSGQEFLLRTLDKIINQDTVGETGSKRDGVMIIHEE